VKEKENGGIMNLKKVSIVLIVVIIIQLIIIGILTSLLLTNQNEEEDQYSNYPMVIRYYLEGGLGDSNYLQIYQDGYYFTATGMAYQNKKSGYLEDTEIQEIYRTLSSYNVSDYHGQFFNTEVTDISQHRLFYFNPFSDEVVSCAGYMTGSDTPDEMMEIFEYLSGLFFKLRE
jgi:hypothetical protein